METESRASHHFILRVSTFLAGSALSLFGMCATYSAVCGQTFEAENGVLSGTQIGTQRGGYTGSGYVTGFDNDGDKVTLTLSAAKGVYELYVRYASPSGDKYNFVLVNEENVGSLSFPASTTFVEIKLGKVHLRQGSNTLTILKEWGYFDLDNVRLVASQPSKISNVSEHLVTPVPQVRADSLYQMLSRFYGKVIISGQYGGAAEFSYIRNISGKTPVIRGFDMIDYSPSREERGAISTETEKAIQWDGERGIVTFCWHWNAPSGLIDQPGKEWWRGFYTEATTFDVSKAMDDVTSEAYALILRDIDAIAIQLKKLSDAGVPVLWRPLHEAEGKWFWWGAKGAEPCKWLWRLMFDRLVVHHALHNLIWIWTSTGSQDALNWYPGDEYVDIIGADIYLSAGNYGSNFLTFDNMAALYEGKKIITLSENGPIPSPQQLFTQRAGWSWFSTWSGDFIADGTINTRSHIEYVYNHDYVITLDEIGQIDEIADMLDQRKMDEEQTITAVVEKQNMWFQNPIMDDRLVLHNLDDASTVQILNAQGKVVFPEVPSNAHQEVEFDFKGKATGMYLVRIRSDRSVKTYRLFK